MLGVLLTIFVGAPAPDISVAVAPPTLVEIAEHTRARLVPPLLSGVSKTRLSVVDQTGGCDQFDQVCADKAASAAVDSGSTFVVRSRIEKVQADFLIDLTLMDRTGAVLTTKSDRCEICGEAELIERVAELVGALVPRLDRLLDAPGSVVIDGEPKGASVRVDGELVGTLPYRGAFPAGEHEVVVEADGHSTATEIVTLEGGVEERVTLHLVAAPTVETPIAGPAPGQTDASPLVPAGWAVGALGLGGVGAGVGLLVLNGRPHQPTCPSEVLDPNGMCPNVYTTGAAGAGALVTGGLALAGGITMIIVGRRSSRVSAAFGPRSFVLTARF